MLKFNTFVLLVLMVLMASCNMKKQVSYFQDVDQLSQCQIDSMATPFAARVCADDMLSIIVTSVDPMAAVPFNLPAVSVMQPGRTDMSYSQSLQYYVVDVEGCINFPVVGKIKVEGLTRQQLIELLKYKLESYLVDPVVSVQFLNYKISVMGEVTKPGTYTTTNERVSVLDALALAGDLTIYGERRNVLLIRDTNGKKEFVRFDLTNANMFSSPFFYLQQNDIIYVEPNKSKASSSRIGASENMWISVVGTLVSVASLITTVISISVK